MYFFVLFSAPVSLSCAFHFNINISYKRLTCERCQFLLLSVHVVQSQAAINSGKKSDQMPVALLLMKAPHLRWLCK